MKLVQLVTKTNVNKGLLSSNLSCLQSYVRHGSSHTTVVVTGASRGIGYAISKKITEKLENPVVYCTTRSSANQLTGLIREEVDPVKAKNVTYMAMECTNIQSIVALRNQIYQEQGQIDILINNAGMYFYPAQDATEHFVQVQRTLDINYWGLKNVNNAFLPMLSEQARIVNISSHFGHLSLIPGSDIKRRLGDPNLTEKDLDEMVMDYQRHSTEFNDDYDVLGWPRCAYTVSKVAVNAYTRILQKQLEEKNRPDIVVNSIHPGSYHSKITQEGEYSMTATEAANSVVTTALLGHPCPHPRGQFIWHDLQVVQWDQEDRHPGVVMRY